MIRILKQGGSSVAGDPQDQTSRVRFRLRRRRRRGFSLMELLVVMTIVAILASISIPVGNIILQRVRIVNAKHMALEVRKAVGTYNSDYGRYPVLADRGGQKTSDAEVESDRALMDVLLGSDDATGPGSLNPRGETYLSPNKASSPKNNPRDGVVYTSSGGGALYDPWGNKYRVLMDVDRDNRCVAPDGDGVVVKDVLVWSLGPNGKDDRGGGDDVVTW